MKLLGLVFALAFSIVPFTAAANGRHLFILSGQSNMARLDPKVSFIPAVEKEFGKENVTVVKYAKGARPIRLWYKDYKFPKGVQGNPKGIGSLYDATMASVKKATAGKKYDTVTFVWMQGERDAKEKLSEVYAKSFKGILAQLKADLKTKDINFVIGRINDFDMQNKKSPHWTKIRDIQVKLAEEDPRGEWINTDDLNNDKKDAIHATKEGFKAMGERFAEKAIALIRKQTK